jgi:hypothetical protein
MPRTCSGFSYFILLAIAAALAAPAASYGDAITSLTTADYLVANGATQINAYLLNDTMTDSFGAVSEAQASAEYVSILDQSVSAFGSSIPGSVAELNNSIYTSGDAQLSFWVEVVQDSGPATTFVPTEIIANFSTNATAGSAPCFTSSGICAEAYASISVNNVFLPSGTICSQSPRAITVGCFSGAGTGSLPSGYTYNATVGLPFQVSLDANGDAGFGGSWSASVDPIFEIDPGLSDAADFALEISAPFATTAPEPSSFSLVASAILLALLGAGVYRKLQTKPGSSRLSTSPDIFTNPQSRAGKRPL